jgi:hypothetical protein
MAAFFFLNYPAPILKLVAWLHSYKRVKMKNPSFWLGFFILIWRRERPQSKSTIKHKQKQLNSLIQLLSKTPIPMRYNQE